MAAPSRLARAAATLAKQANSRQARGVAEQTQLGQLARLSVRMRAERTLLKILLATSFVGIALVARLAIHDHISPYRALFFIPTVVLATIFIGRGFGIFTSVLSTAVLLFFFVEPAYSFAVARSEDGLGLIFFLAISTSLVLLIEPLQEGLVSCHSRVGQVELLMKEMQHRMRNNLQIAAALVTLQSRQLEGDASTALTETAGRLTRLATIQDRLQDAQKQGSVDGGAFISALCNEIRAGLIGLRPINLSVEAASEPIAADKAVPLGLCLNELVTNALKYAFPGDRSGNINVIFRREGSRLVLSVADDGVGMANAAADGHNSSGLGAKLVRAMVAQLAGTMAQEPSPGGTAWKLYF